jgi:2-C-methyl-D-erythritol 4-phosphate cytidylyltransferase
MEIRHISKPNICAIIDAAGESRRMNGVDKLLAPLAGKPVLVWSIEAFQNCAEINRIVLVNNRKNLEQVECLRIEKKWSKVSEVCLGGERRQDSVAAGLKLIKDCDWVVIHDGARPLITQEIILKGLEAAKETGAAASAVPVTDTIKLAGNDQLVIETPPRSNLWAVQTPQIFRYSLLKDAYLQGRGDVTDDATLVEQIGSKVKLYMGSYNNIKITTPHDLAVAELLLRENAK